MQAQNKVLLMLHLMWKAENLNQQNNLLDGKGLKMKPMSKYFYLTERMRLSKMIVMRHSIETLKDLRRTLVKFRQRNLIQKTSRNPMVHIGIETNTTLDSAHFTDSDCDVDGHKLMRFCSKRSRKLKIRYVTEITNLSQECIEEDRTCTAEIDLTCNICSTQLLNHAVNSGLIVDIDGGAGVSILLMQRSSSTKWPILQGITVSATDILCSELSYSRDDAYRRSSGRDSLLTSSSVDLVGSCMQTENSLQCFSDIYNMRDAVLKYEECP
ncbi:hypothetical protein KSP39_PZI021778 [Platanthera zijinensis]|uniref:Uncharacterized protein n=1 Tax=Platanthera zijinensis TaxID=2320716 RepID=A0AAP0AWY0_9ASPA